MITAARPNNSGPCHFYTPQGKPVWSVPNKSKPGEFRDTTVSDARKLGLVPSPTTVLKLLHRHALVEWMIEQAILATATTPRKDGEEIDAFIERVIHRERIQDEERNVAANRGKAIHRAIQDSFSMIEPDPALAPFVIPARNAVASLGRVVATEKVLVGDGYSGMTDVIAENDHEIWDIDFKTCRRLPDRPYDEQRLQVGAYCGALGNTGNKRIRGALIHISTAEPGQIRVSEVDNWQEDYERFKLLLSFWRKTYRQGDVLGKQSPGRSKWKNRNTSLALKRECFVER